MRFIVGRMIAVRGGFEFENLHRAKASHRPYGAVSINHQVFPGFRRHGDSTLHPTDEDLSVGTPAWAIVTSSLRDDNQFSLRNVLMRLPLARGLQAT